MPPPSQRLTELEQLIAATEENIALLTWVIERRAMAGKDATRLKELVRSTQTRLSELEKRRKRLLKGEQPD